MSKKISINTKNYLSKHEAALLRASILKPRPNDWFSVINRQRDKESQRITRKIYILAKQFDIKNNPKMVPVFLLKIKAWIRETKPHYSQRL